MDQGLRSALRTAADLLEGALDIDAAEQMDMELPEVEELVEYLREEAAGEL